MMMVVLLLSLMIQSTEQAVPMSSLPSFANDNSEVFIAAIIEREFDTSSLYLDTILMGHKALSHMPQLPFLSMNQSLKTISRWKDVASKWNPDQQLNLTNSGYLCKVHINNHENTVNSYYYTNAYYVPDTTTNDNGFNRNINVLRCRLKNSQEIYKKVIKKTLYGPISKLIVEIVRSNENLSIIKFSVPYRSRRTGYGFSINRRGSKFDPWLLNSNKNTTTIYSCMSTVRPLEPYRSDTGLPMLIENIEHSLSLGIDHIFIGIFLDWKSVHYQRYSLALHTYITAGKVTLSSMSLEGSNADDVVGILGAEFLADYVKWIHHTQCLYMSKGQANYVVIQHASEMISLASKFNSLHELLHTYKLPSNDQSKTNSITPCYYLLQSYGLLDPKSSSSFGPMDSHWTSSWFREESVILGPIDGWEVLVLNTSNVWAIGWHVAGACRKQISDSSDIPWSSDSINHKTHAFTIPLEKDGGAAVYFYRGIWEDFQLTRPRKIDGNLHLQRYGSDLQARLEAKGFTISDGALNYRINKDIAERDYPSYFHQSNSHKGRSGKMKGSSVNAKDIVTVNLSVQRHKINDAILPFVVAENSEKIVIGRANMKLRDGSWIECSEKCKNFKEILTTI